MKIDKRKMAPIIHIGQTEHDFKVDHSLCLSKNTKVSMVAEKQEIDDNQEKEGTM